MSIEVAVLGMVVLLLGNAFFVGAEFSMVAVRRSAIEPLAAKGSKRARITLRALENISFLMAGAQLGITLCSLALGAVAEPAIAHFLEKPFHQLHVPEMWLHPLSFVIALAVTVFLHVVIGEMVPKNIALAKPERSALILTPALVGVVRILKPLVSLLNALANASLKLFDIKPQAEVSSAYTRDEMADLVKESRQEGLLSEDNEQLLSGALSFDARPVKDIAIPLEKLTMVEATATYKDVETIAVKTGFSRLPVRGKRKKLLGYIRIKDVITADAIKRNQSLSRNDIRELPSINDSQSIRMTLKIMQRSGTHLILVTNGKKITGLVSMEDVLEELVGEMRR